MGPMCDGAGIGVTPPVLGGHDHLPQKIKKLFMEEVSSKEARLGFIFLIERDCGCRAGCRLLQ